VGHEDLGRDANWFDGDGMLSGVAFRRISLDDGRIIPEFANQFILTDLYLSKKTTAVSSPIMPSITTLVNPLSTLFQIILSVLRTVFLVLLSHLPGSQQAIKRISVANTSILYYDGRALATCESGPPIRIQLPSLDTVGWFNGIQAEGEQEDFKSQLDARQFGGHDALSFLKEWTTGHPKVDKRTGEMLLYHNTFLSPFVHYSVIQSSLSKNSNTPKLKLINEPVAGVSGAKMMHDFGASHTQTIIMDLPLSLDSLNLLRNREVVSYDPSKPSRFGVFPRHKPHEVRWFTSPACCIFHTANAWDTTAGGKVVSVNLLACRIASATLTYSAGNIAPPNVSSNTKHIELEKTPLTRKTRYLSPGKRMCHYEKGSVLESSASTPNAPNYPSAHASEDNDQCRLYYYEFGLSATEKNQVSHEWALSAIPFEFPSVRPDCEMQRARYVYGCTTSSSCFGVALGKAVKIDAIAKIDSKTLIQNGKEMNITPVTGCVDERTVGEILDEDDKEGSIQCFRLPRNHFAQEPRFIPRSSSDEEDAGYLLFYVFDESQLTMSGECPQSAVSELWILDAESMRNVVAKITLPQRVAYGLHGTRFSHSDIEKQRDVKTFRSLEQLRTRKDEGVFGRRQWWCSWIRWRDVLEKAVG
jgi:carotenoid cleavage dioxygenase-like enzyme